MLGFVKGIIPFMILTSHCTISFIGATSLARNRSLLYQAECSGFHRGAENHTSGSHVGCPTERRIAHYVVSKDSLTFSGQNQFQMASIEMTFHGEVSDTALSGTADMTSRSMILGPAMETATLSLIKQ